MRRFVLLAIVCCFLAGCGSVVFAAATPVTSCFANISGAGGNIKASGASKLRMADFDLSNGDVRLGQTLLQKISNYVFSGTVQFPAFAITTGDGVLASITTQSEGANSIWQSSGLGGTRILYQNVYGGSGYITVNGNGVTINPSVATGGSFTPITQTCPSSSSTACNPREIRFDDTYFCRCNNAGTGWKRTTLYTY